MSHTDPEVAARPSRTRALLIALAAVVLVVAVALTVWRATASPDAAPGAAPDPSSSATTEATPSPTGAPTPSPTGPPAGSPAPEASAGAGAVDPAAPAAPADGQVPAFADPVPSEIESPVDVTEGVAVTVSALEAVDGDGVGPGEIDGPAVRFTVSVVNSTSQEVSLTSAAVNAYFGESLTPGIQLSGSGARALPAAVPPGGTVDGVYVFLLPEDRTPTRVEVFSVPQAAVVVAQAPTPAG
ncbi:hypothetical protein [uncultured Cellulomonas sp.]|uniref:hypothetical protein n=1 Tax=uncultured Cellulomonas sp. TaxID=189682 RepID=UPI00261A0357|nr:hypothetical protein [uncultured Cellulomonas sp.]